MKSGRNIIYTQVSDNMGNTLIEHISYDKEIAIAVGTKDKVASIMDNIWDAIFWKIFNHVI